MAGFADGFSSGLNMMLSARRLALYEEDAEAKRKEAEQADMPIADVDPALGTSFKPGTTVGQAEDISSLRTAEQNIRTSEQQIAASKATTALTEKRGQLIDLQLDPERIARMDLAEKLNVDMLGIQVDMEKLDYENARTYKNAKLGLNVFGSLASVAAEKDRVMGTASYDAAIIDIAGQTIDGYKNGDIDMLKVIAPKFVKATQTLAPIINQGMQNPEVFENLNLGDYGDSLNQLFSMKSQKYVGKKYIASDGTEGEITKVTIDFDSFAIDPESVRGGGTAVLKGDFTYKDAEGNEYTKTSFIPDAGKAVIRETQDGSDARSVSLNDMIDYSSSAVSLVNESIANTDPGVFRVARDAEEIRVAMLERDPTDLQRIKANAVDIFLKNQEALNRTWVTGNLNSVATKIGSNDSIGEDRAIKSIMGAGLDIMSDIDIISGQDAKDLGFEGDGPFYRFKRNDDGSLIKTPKQAAFDSLPTINDLETRLKKGTAFEDRELSIGAGGILSFNGLDIDRMETRTNYLPKIKQQYPEEDIDALVENIIERYRVNFPNNPPPSDYALLELLNKTLKYSR
jgi:hypothetical protein